MIKAIIFDFFDVIRTDAYKAWLAANNTPHEGAYFDAIIVSSEVGMVKPSPEIFHLALTKLGVEPSESIFIDDNIRHVEAASKIGIHSIQFKSAEQLKADLVKFDLCAL